MMKWELKRNANDPGWTSKQGLTKGQQIFSMFDLIIDDNVAAVLHIDTILPRSGIEEQQDILTLLNRNGEVELDVTLHKGGG